MSSPAPARRSPFARPVETGPRARFSQLLPYLAEHRPAIAGVVALGVVGSVASLGQPLLVSQVITRVQAGDPLDLLVFALVALVVVSALLNGFSHYLLQRVGTSVVFSARRTLVARLLRLPIREFDDRRTGDLVSRVGADTTMLYAVLTQGLVDSIAGSLVFVGAIVGMAILDPVLLGLTVLVIALAIGVVSGLAGRIRVASKEQQTKVGDLAASVERAIGAIRTVRAANATERETTAITEDARGAWRAGIRVARVSALVVPVSGVALQVALLVVIGVGGFRVASGATSIASLVAFILFLFMMIMPLGQAFGAVTSVNQALGALGRIQEIIDLPSENEGDTSVSDAEPALNSESAAISFEFVKFGYDDNPVLHDVSFTVARGSRTALVGPSGAGKSTMLALIERFYDPTAGVVRLGGVDIRALDRDALRSQIGYVEQDAPVLAGSIRDNLLLAAPSATDEECIAVLRTVNLGEVLDRSDAGLDAEVGEEGVMLSGGERQRLAIARTLLAAPPILLLDESTSSLDGLNEQLLREAIDAVAEERTLIVIAHRLSTVVDSDQIVVLDHGRVVGVGTHSELVKSTPLYKDLAKHQLLV
jgi:ABC-type multidrug transport system fused ATPase/permease subunit